MKKCSKCKHILDESNFHKNKSTIDGLNNYCKKCRKKYNSLLIVKEKQKLYRKNYYQNNREYILERNR